MDQEYYLRFSLPRKLKLTGSKNIGMRRAFQEFADYIDMIKRTNNSQEFKTFWNEFRNRIDKASKRSPRGTKVILRNDVSEKYILVDKKSRKRIL